MCLAFINWCCAPTLGVWCNGSMRSSKLRDPGSTPGTPRPPARTHARSCARAPARTRAHAHARDDSLATLLLKLHSSMEEHRSHEPGIPGQYRVELASLIGATASTAAYEASGRSRFDSSVRHAAETLAPANPGLGNLYTK